MSYCLVHYVDVGNRSKFAPNAQKGFLYECTDKGYVIFSNLHKILVKSCDVKCIESIVYGDSITDYPKPLPEILNMGDDSQLDDQPIADSSRAAAIQVDSLYVNDW